MRIEDNRLEGKETVLLSSIPVGTAFTAITPYPFAERDYLLKTYEGRVVSLSNPSNTWTTPTDHTFQDIQVLDSNKVKLVIND